MYLVKYLTYILKMNSIIVVYTYRYYIICEDTIYMMRDLSAQLVSFLMLNNPVVGQE